MPEDNFVVCNNMTCGSPLQLKRSRTNEHPIFSDGGDFPLLTVEDRKISATFECLIAGMFWGGLEALMAGIAVAALVVATVATGGLALVAAGVAVGACAVGIVSGGTALYKIAHDCDVTLESKWDLEHKSVFFDDYKALLNSSILYCNKGGKITLIMDKALAMEAAKNISDPNMNAF